MCTCSSVPISPVSLQDGQPHVSTQQHSTIPALSLDRVTLLAGTTVFFQFHMKHHLTIPSRSVSRWRGLLNECCGVLLFPLDLAPGGVAGRSYSIFQVGQRTCMELSLMMHIQGKHQQWQSPDPPLVLSCSLSFQRTLSVSQPSLCGLSRLLCKSCSIGSQLSLRKNFSKYRCVFDGRE